MFMKYSAIVRVDETTKITALYSTLPSICTVHTRQIQTGGHDRAARLPTEWNNLKGCRTVIDGDQGNVTPLAPHSRALLL